MGDYQIICKPEGDNGGGGGEEVCPLVLDVFPNRTFTGPGQAFGQFGWNRRVSSATSGVIYNGNLGRVIINEAGTYEIIASLTSQCENTSGPWDYITLQAYHPTFAAPSSIVFSTHVFSSGADSITTHTAMRTLVVSQAMLDADPLNQYTFEFVVIIRDVPAGNTLTIVQELTTLRIKKICGETPFTLFTIPSFTQPI